MKNMPTCCIFCKGVSRSFYFWSGAQTPNWMDIIAYVALIAECRSCTEMEIYFGGDYHIVFKKKHFIYKRN